jgi:hypothetical protein
LKTSIGFNAFRLAVLGLAVFMGAGGALRAETSTGLSIVYTHERSPQEILDVTEVWNEKGKQYRIEYGSDPARPGYRKFITAKDYDSAIGSVSSELEGLRQAVQKSSDCRVAKIRFKDPAHGFGGSLCEGAKPDYAHGAMVARVIKRFTALLRPLE